MAFINIIILVVFAMELCMVLKRKITDTLPIAGFSIIIGVYILSLLDMLEYTIPCIIICLLILTMYIVVQTKRRLCCLRDSLKRDICIPGFVAFLFIVILIYYISIDARCFQWDEFSHWSTTVKDMFFTNRLSIYEDSVTTFRSYQPGMALWQYFFVTMYSKWSDGVIIFAYNVYLVLMMTPIFSKVKWKQFWLIPVLLIVIYCMPYWFYRSWEGTAWHCVYIDRAISLTLAYIMYNYFKYDEELENGRIDILPIALGISVISLFKSIGVVFTLFTVLAIAVDVLIVNRNQLKEKLISIAKCVGVWLVVYEAWDLKLKIVNTNQAWNTSKITMRAVINLLFGKEEAWMYDVTDNFWSRICTGGLQDCLGVIDIHIIALPMVWLLVLFCISILSGSKKIFKRNNLLTVVLIVEFAIYEFSLLLTELYVFNQLEAQSLAGLARYSSNYALGINCFVFMYLFGMLTDSSYKSELNIKAEVIVCAMLFIVCTIPFKQVVTDVFEHDKAVETAYSIVGFDKYFGLEEKLSNILNQENSVYILSSQDGYGYFVLRKFMIPAKTNSIEEAMQIDNYLYNWQENIVKGKYEYIYVNGVTEAFTDMYSGYFEGEMIEDQTLYKVEDVGGLHFLKVAM